MPMNRNPVKLLSKSYQSEKKNIKLIADDIYNAIYDTVAGGELANQGVYLAIDEAVSNAMEHGNKWDSQKHVDINVFKTDSEIKIIIKDTGQGFDTGKINYELDKTDILKTRGRGIFIMNKFCNLKWNKTGNELEMIIRKEYISN
jgi:anti-sigma regulatory factor (Ser/Thr protein kinase)